MYLKQVRINSDSFPTRTYYPFNITIIETPSEIAFRRPVTFFVGENGSGKSTVLEAIARKCGVHPWHRPKRHQAHRNPYETSLRDHVSTTWTNGRVPTSFFRSETFHDFADFLDDVALCDPGRLQYHGGQILNTLSHGQGILAYFSGRFRVKGLYFLDEPESALSPMSQVRFLKMLRQYEDQGQAQFIIATHSPILLAYPGAQVYSFDGVRIREVAYQETSHYQIYKEFFCDRAAFFSS
jgi:predicted ATPase